MADERGYALEDLASTNGTFVNGVRLVSMVRVSPRDSIGLGRSAPMPWPMDSTPDRVSLRLGRDPDNDVVIDLPMISGQHARIEWDGVSESAWIEDQGSSNGTSVGTRERANGRLQFSSVDIIYLGSHAVSGASLMDRLGRQPSTSPTPSGAEVVGPVVGGSSGIAARASLFAVLLGQAVLIAGAIIAAGGTATMLSWLAVATIWFGMSAVVFDRLGPWRDGRPPDLAAAVRFPLLALGIVGQCVLSWAIVSAGVGLKAPAAASIALMFLASTVGAALGGMIVTVRPRPRQAYLAAVVAVAAIGLLGGGHPRSYAVAAVMPSRWAFEGLLLLEAGRTPAGRGLAADLAEPFFPSRSERTGIRACVLALGFMAVGLSASAAFIAWGPGSASRPRSPSHARVGR